METTVQQSCFELSIPSEFGYEKIAREAVAAFARKLGFEGERIEDLKTALGEACINAIEHGNQRDIDLRVDVCCIAHNQTLTIDIDDQGVRRFAGCGSPATIDSKIGGAAPFRGMGLMLIRKLVDEADFIDAPAGVGNRFRLIIHRTHVSPTL